MKFISWNVNGFRAVLGKGFADFFESADADIFCIQETKMQPGQADFAPEGYYCYWNSAEKKGYSGTAIFAKQEPLSVTYGINGKHTDEGRVITLEYPKFYFVGAYVPNAQDGLRRIDYRMEYEDDLRAYLSSLDSRKPVIYCGDLNVAHNEIDLKNPKANIGNPGFSYEERAKLDELFATNDLCAVGRLLEYWEREARNLGDKRGLIEILNEEIGYFRRTAEKEKALSVIAMSPLPVSAFFPHK
jgi:exodeoxyribonuclease-3